jgi:hypothetical protein
MEKKKKTGLEQYFYNLSALSAYAGAHQLRRKTRKKFDSRTIAKWLEGQDAYTLHKIVRH